MPFDTFWIFWLHIKINWETLTNAHAPIHLKGFCFTWPGLGRTGIVKLLCDSTKQPSLRVTGLNFSNPKLLFTDRSDCSFLREQLCTLPSSQISIFFSLKWELCYTHVFLKIFLRITKINSVTHNNAYFIWLWMVVWFVLVLG